MGWFGRKLGPLYLMCAGLFVLTVVGAVLYVQRDLLLVHYHVWQATDPGETPAGSATWLRERTHLALPVLLSQFADRDPDRCNKAAELLRDLLSGYRDPTNPEHSHLTLSVATKLREVFSTLSPTGKARAVDVARGVLAVHLDAWSPNVPTALETAGGIFESALRDPSIEVRLAALGQLRTCWTWQGADGVLEALVRDWQHRCYRDAAEMLESELATIRAAAATALAGAPFHEADLALVSRWRDPDPAVRKAALVALVRSGEAGDVLTSEQKSQLIDLLHDPDAEIRDAVARLLRGAGVSEPVLRLATLIKHPSPVERAKVVSEAFRVADIDPVRWVLELADDPSPSVRLAVARAASTTNNEELRRRLETMAASDPDPLVRDMSQQFLALSLSKGASPAPSLGHSKDGSERR